MVNVTLRFFSFFFGGGGGGVNHLMCGGLSFVRKEGNVLLVEVTWVVWTQMLAEDSP